MKNLITIFIVFAAVAAKAQYPQGVFIKPNNSFGTTIPRLNPDSTLYVPTGCGVPTDSTWLFSQGTSLLFPGYGQKLRKAAIYYDSCGHHLYGWDPSLQNWHRIDSGSGGSSFDSITTQGGVFHTGNFNDARYRQILDTAYAHLLMTRAGAYKISDSLNLVFRAAFVANLLKVQYLGYDFYANHPTGAGTMGVFIARDSIPTGAIFWDSAGVMTNLTPYVTLSVRGKGQPGDTTMITLSGSILTGFNINVAAMRDSVGSCVHHIFNADGSITLYSTCVVSVTSPTGSISTSTTSGAVHVDLPSIGAGAGTCSNCTVTFDTYGRETGYSTGSLTTTFYRPEDFGGGTSITDNRAAIQSCDSAANADPNKKTCYLGAGIYQVQMSSLKSGGPAIGPIKLYSNTTITGAGLQTIIKLKPAPGGATFGPVSAPTTFTSNTNFYNLFELDSVNNVTVENMLLNGTLSQQINKDASGTDPIGAPDPYKNPQDGTTTANVQTDGILILKGANNFVYNLEVDSFVGYGVHVVRALNTDVYHINSYGNINGNVYFADSNAGGAHVPQSCAGSILHNSTIIGSYADNVRIIASYIRVESNEIAWSRPRPVSASVNFANIYLQSNVGSGVLGVDIHNNYLHDASAFGIDQFQLDTVYSTYKGQSDLISGNRIENSGAGGIQVALPYVKVANNTFLNEGVRQDGYVDSGSQCDCGVHLATSGWGPDIQNNSFIDRNKIMRGGMLTAQTPMANMTFADNTAVGMTAFSNSTPTIFSGPPFNNIHGNQFVDTGGAYHAMFTLDNGGALHISPSQGTNGALPQAVTIDDFTGDGQLYIYHLGSSTSKKGYLGFQSQNGLEMKVIGDENGDYLGVGRGTITGRELLVQDGQTGVNRWGIDSSGAHYIGPGTATGTSGVGWSVKTQQPVALTPTFPYGVDVNYAHTSGSTNFTLEAAMHVLIGPGWTGTTGYTVGGFFGNTNTSNTGSIQGAGNSLGHYGIYSEAFGAATGANGTNFGVQLLAGNAMRNVGFFAEADWNQFNNASASSIGGLIYAKRANASALETGLYIGMQGGTPTLTSAGLIVDNGSEGIPVQKWQIGNVDKVTIDQNAKMNFNQTTTTAAPFNTGAGVAAPTTPVDNDWWTLGGHAFVRLSGVTYQLDQQATTGIYVPTATGTANVTSATGDSATWTRIGNTVSVVGVVQITPTSTGTTTSITLNTPINSTATVGAITTAGQASAWTSNTVGIVANSGSNNTVILEYVSPGTAGINTFYYRYSYQVQ